MVSFKPFILEVQIRINVTGKCVVTKILLLGNKSTGNRKTSTNACVK